MSDVTRAPGAPPPPAPPPELTVAPVEAAPGQATTVTFSLRNRSAESCSYALSVLGLEPEWIEAPARLGPVAPGATLEGTLTLKLPTGYPASTLVGSLSVRSIEASGGPAAVADLVATVGDGSLVLGSLEPSEVHGWRGGRLVVNLRNRGLRPMQVSLAGESENARLGVAFEDANPVLDPASERRVTARIRMPFLLVGAPKRHPFGVRVQGRATPVILSGAAVQRPLFSKRVMKVLALGSVATLWIGAAVVGITKLSSHLQKTAIAKSVASSPPLSPPSTAVSGSGAGGVSGGAGGSGGGGSSGGASAGVGLGAGPRVRIVGKVSGAAPGGVTVTLTPTSLANTNTQGATMVGPTAVLTGDYHFDDAPTNSSAIADGKIYGTMLGATVDAGLTAAASEPTMSTTTNPDGTWAIAGVRAPGTYLVTFSKAGFETQKYIVTTTSAGTTMTLNAAILPGSGDISGAISDPSGPLGGVTVTLTDGTVTLTTYTPTLGSDVGQWALTGLTTPGTYLVTATKAGYGTETTIVNLAASGSASGVDLSLRSGVGSITGTVVSARGATGIGGVTVTATNGSTTESATTTTDAKVGSYTLPNLPIPGTYALTISGSGWITQTRKVDLSGNTVVGASLTPAGADVIGFAYDAAGTGLGAAGVVLSNAKVTYKTLTQSTTPVGSFDFGQVPAGTYVLTVEDYGYTTASAQVVVHAGEVSTIDLALTSASAASLDTGTIQGSVYDLFDAQPLSGIAILMDGKSETTSGSNGTFQINSVPPGVHTITADPTTAQGFEAESVQVNVPLGGTVISPPLELPVLGSLGGTVTSGAGTGVIDGATVTLESASPSTTTTTLTGTATTTSTSTTTTTTAGESVYDTVTTGADGTYDFTDLLSGSYELVVSATNYVSQTLDVSLAADQDLNENVTLSLEPDFNVIAYASSTSGSTGLSQTAGICVTLTGPSYDETELTSASGETTFTPLTSGDSYTASFLEPSTTLTDASQCAGATSIGTANSYTFTAAYNNVSVYSVIIAASVPAVAVELSFQYELPGTSGSNVGSTVDCPVVSVTGATEPDARCPILASTATLPTVSLTGITGFSEGSGGNLGTPTYSSAIDAISPGGTTSDVWNFTTTQLSSLVSDQVTITISGTGTPFETVTPAKNLATSSTCTGITGQCYALILIPTPVTVTGTVKDAVGNAIDNATLSVNPSSIPPSSLQNGASTAQITASDESGGIVWGDSSVGTSGDAEPGEYEVSGSYSGYQSADASPYPVYMGVTCNPNCTSPTSYTLTGASTSLDVTLAEETTLTVSMSSNYQSAYTSLHSSASVGLPTIYLLYDNALVSSSNPSGGAVTVTDGNTSTQTTASSLTLQSDTDSATFAALPPSTDYSLVVVAPGFQTWFDPLTITSSGGTVDVTADPDPTVDGEGVEEGIITGTVEGSVLGASSDLSGVTVTATLVASPSCPAETLPSYYSNTNPGTSGALTATTNSSGVYVITGSAALGTSTSTASVNDGLCPNATYQLSFTYAGYTGTTVTTADIVAGDNSQATETMTANPMSQTIDITAGAGTFAANAYPTVSETNAVTYSPTLCEHGSEPSGCSDNGSGSAMTSIQFTVTVYPTAYFYTITAAGFGTLSLSQISYTAGETPSTLNITLEQANNTITGTVKTAGGTAVDNLEVDLYNGDGSLQTSTTETNGTYTFTPEPSGQYYVEPDLAATGYEDTGSPAYIVTAYPNTTYDDIAVQAVPLETLTVTVTTSAYDANLSGRTVDLTETGNAGVSCLSTSGTTKPLLVTGLGTSQTATLSDSSPYTATFTSVVPDDYSLFVSGSGIPSQSDYATPIEICPNVTTSETASTSYEVLEGEISGTLSLSPSETTTPSLSVVHTSVGTVVSSAVTCPSGTFSSCTYASYVSLGDSYEVTPTLASYAASPLDVTTAVLTGTSTTVANATENFTFDTTLAPTVTGFSSSSGQLTGTAVTIDGTNFIPGMTVAFGSVGAATVQSVSADGTSAMITYPTANSDQTVDVQVTTPAGVSAVNPDDEFTYTG